MHCSLHSGAMAPKKRFWPASAGGALKWQTPSPHGSLAAQAGPPTKAAVKNPGHLLVAFVACQPPTHCINLTQMGAPPARPPKTLGNATGHAFPIACFWPKGSQKVLENQRLKHVCKMAALASLGCGGAAAWGHPLETSAGVPCTGQLLGWWGAPLSWQHLGVAIFSLCCAGHLWAQGVFWRG